MMNLRLFLLCVLAAVSLSVRSQVPAAYSSSIKPSYVREWEANRPLATAAAVTSNTSISEVSQSTQYVDGLGRALQTVGKRQSPALKDLVTAQVYDQFGRETYKFLPFPAANDNGNFKLDPFQQETAFYPGYLAQQQESSFFEYTKFEPSPLNRPLEIYAPGKSWAGTAQQSVEADRHGVDMRYSVNTANDNVQRWKVTEGPADNFGSYSIVEAYTLGALIKTITEDEHGGQVIEFTDKEGRLILKKVLLTANRDLGGGQGHSGWLNTYYIYDDLGNLRCVLQPGATATISGTPGWQLSNATVLKEQCFRYEYDARKRLIMKQVAGGGIVEMVYNIRDLLVMMRDENLKASGHWQGFGYDAHNRMVNIRLLPNTAGRSAHQANASSSTTYPNTVGDIMQENYYDGYGWMPATPPTGVAATLHTVDITSNYFITTYNAAPYYAQQITADFNNVKGRQTGSKVRIFGTSNFITTVTFYDKDGRVIQTRANNITSGGYDITTTQYDFRGKPLRVLHRQEKGGAMPRFIRELTKIEYDHAGRVTTISKKIGNIATTERVVVDNSYDELGRLKTKTLGNNLETQTLEYNVRGWLLGANRSYVRNASTNYFGYELAYDNSQSTISGTSYTSPHFNGNIAGLTWRSRGDGERRRYDFGYDAASRLKTADFNQYNGTVFNKQAGVDFSVAGLDYDVNGNILKMKQTGWKINNSSLVDDLTYTYQNQSNKLAKVADLINDPNSKLGDFKDGANTNDDYAYDGNGNLTLDRNKGITSILYNHLNLPYEINITGKGKIQYTYDNTGTKLRKIVTDNTVTPAKVTTWLYMQNVVYRNDTIEFFTFEEGRARYDVAQGTPEATKFDFDYFLKDHLGNVRMVLTEKLDTAAYPPATLEWERRETEQQYYDIKSAQVKLKSEIPGAGSYSSLETRLYKVHGGIEGQRTGLGMVLKVMQGDAVRIRAESFYNMPGGGVGSPLTIALTELLTAFAGSGTVAGKGLTPTNLSGIANNTSALTGLMNTSPGSTIANAHLCWVLFDDQFRYVTGNVDPVQSGGGYKNHTQFINNPVNVSKSGYLYIFVSNRSNFDVFFDNLTVTHLKGRILEETHYYPFGLTMAGISSKAIGNIENKKRFNGIEQTTELDLNQYDAFFRTMDPQIGRWWQIDPKPNMSESGYSMMSNNPLRYSDPLGDTLVNKDDQKIAKSMEKSFQKTNDKLTKERNDKQAQAASGKNGNKALSQKQIDKLNRQVADLNNRIDEVQNSMDRLNAVIADPSHGYTFNNIGASSSTGQTFVNSSGHIQMDYTGSTSNFAHELAHGSGVAEGRYTIVTNAAGQLGFRLPTGTGLGAFEVRAYRAQYAFDPKSIPNSENGNPVDMNGITEDYIHGIKSDGNFLYPRRTK